MSRSTPKATTRVEQLIALATDPAATEEEARTAALAACRGIRKEGLKIGSEDRDYDDREDEWEPPPRGRRSPQSGFGETRQPARGYASYEGAYGRAPTGAPRLPGGPAARSTALTREHAGPYDRTLEATFLANTSGYEIGGEEGPSKQPDFAFGFGVVR